MPPTDSCCKKVHFFLVLFLLALLLGTVCACIVFALEISKLKSETASTQLASSRQQSQNALDFKVENLTQQMSIFTSIIYQQFNLSYSALEKIQDLNASSSTALEQSYSALKRSRTLMPQVASPISSLI